MTSYKFLQYFIMVLHNAGVTSLDYHFITACDYHFIIKELAKQFEVQFEYLGEIIEKYITFLLLI